MVIRNVSHPNIKSWKMFVVKMNTKWVVHIALVESIGQELGKFSLPPVKFRFTYCAVQVVKKQLPIRGPFAGSVQKGQGQTINNVILGFRFKPFSPGQFYVAILGIKKFSCHLLFHKRERTPSSTAPIHNMPGSASNPVLREAATFAEGR